MKEITVSSHKREEFVDITDLVQQEIINAEWGRGILLLFCPHTTAALTVNEAADPDVTSDMVKHFASMVPAKADFSHAEGNSDAHIKASILGPSLSLIVEHGAILLGTWQGIYLFEGDGPRKRNLWLQFIEASCM